jgi:hypothetical protein
MVLQQVPSGLGPVGQAPPHSFGRVHFQVPLVSPSFVVSTGVHSVVARQSPAGLGPIRQGQPVHAWPQIQFWFGRS